MHTERKPRKSGSNQTSLWLLTEMQTGDRDDDEKSFLELGDQVLSNEIGDLRVDVFFDLVERYIMISLNQPKRVQRNARSMFRLSKQPLLTSSNSSSSYCTPELGSRMYIAGKLP